MKNSRLKDSYDDIDKDDLINYTKNHLHGISQSLPVTHPLIYKKIIDTQTGDKFTQKLYNFIYGEVYCLNCNKNLSNFICFNKGYGKYCSNKCKSNHTEFRQEYKQIMLDRHGDTNPSKIKKFVDKKKRTTLKNYGVNHHMKNPKFLSDFVQRDHLNYINKKLKENPNVSPLFDLKDYDNCRETYKWKCNLCNHVFNHGYIYKHDPICPNCQKKVNSRLELEISNFLEELNIKYKKNDRTVIKPHEIDFLLLDYSIGIELDGVYWHSELQGKDKYYHLNKSITCKEKGIQLIHIFDYEWINKLNIVKSIIRSKLGLNKRIFARKCVIREISVKNKNEFLTENHIQGADKSTVKLGLFYEDRLVSVATFCKSRFNKKVEWEVSRYVNIININVIGAFGKLLKYFERNYNPKSMITYADKRFFDGNVYNKVGFEYMHDTKPNYFYFLKSNTLHSRQTFQKHKLPKLLENFDSTLTEWENMKLNGYNRIWDCGNSVYIKKYERL